MAQFGVVGMFAMFVIKELIGLVRWTIERQRNGRNGNGTSNGHTPSNGIPALVSHRLADAIDKLVDAGHQQIVLLERINNNVTELRHDVDELRHERKTGV